MRCTAACCSAAAQAHCALCTHDRPCTTPASMLASARPLYCCSCCPLQAVVLLDADFVVSASLAARMNDDHYRKTATHLLQQHVALVLPAFETTRGGEEGAELAVQVGMRRG